MTPWLPTLEAATMSNVMNVQRQKHIAARIGAAAKPSICVVAAMSADARFAEGKLAQHADQAGAWLQAANMIVS